MKPVKPAHAPHHAPASAPAHKAKAASPAPAAPTHAPDAKLCVDCPECGAQVVQTADWFATHFDFDCLECGARSETPDLGALRPYEEPVDKMRAVMQALKTRDGESRGR